MSEPPPEAPQGEQGETGLQGDPGPSVYDIWLVDNPGGTLEQFFESLKGAPGDPGPAGLDSTEPGEPGDNGLSAYQVWQIDNPGGTRAQFIEAIRGPAGPAGPRSPAEIRTVNSDVRRIYSTTTVPPDGVQPGDLQLNLAPAPVAGTRWSTGSPQSIPSNSYETLGLGNNTDYSGGVSTSSGGMSVPVDGWYHVAAGVTLNTATGYRIFVLQKNGSNVHRVVGPDSGQNVTTFTISTVMRLLAGDSLSCTIWQNSGSSLSTSVSFGYPYLTVALVGGG